MTVSESPLVIRKSGYSILIFYWDLYYKMQISEEHLKKYQTIFFEVYGYEIDKTQALTELTSLVCLINAVHKHLNTKPHAKRVPAE